MASPLIMAWVLLGASSSARADLSSPVTVTLTAPGGLVGNATPVSLTDVVIPSAGISVGDGSHIGSFMLTGEFIHFSGNSILLDIAAGNVDAQGHLITGYLGSGNSHAQYQLTNIGIAGNTIVGISGSFAGLASPTTFAGFVSLVSPNTVTVNLDNLIFTPVANGGQSDAFATVTINLAIQAVPEPASWALMLAGAAGIAGWRRVNARSG